MTTVDATSGTAVFELGARLYRAASLPLAARAFASKADFSFTRSRTRLVVSLRSRGPAGEAELRDLAAEFMNEVLCLDRRADVVGLNKGQIKTIVARAIQSTQQSPEQEKRGRVVTERLRDEAERLIQELRTGPVRAEAVSR